MASSTKFRVTVNLSNFFADHRTTCRLFIQEKFKTIGDLENHIKGIFKIDHFILTSQNCYLPSSEDIGVLTADDIIHVLRDPNAVVEARKKPSTSKAYQDCDVCLARQEYRNRKRKKCETVEITTQTKDEEPNEENLKNTKKKKKKKNTKDDDCSEPLEQDLHVQRRSSTDYLETKYKSKNKNKGFLMTEAPNQLLNKLRAEEKNFEDYEEKMVVDECEESNKISEEHPTDISEVKKDAENQPLKCPSATDMSSRKASDASQLLQNNNDDTNKECQKSTSSGESKNSFHDPHENSHIANGLSMEQSEENVDKALDYTENSLSSGSIKILSSSNRSGPTELLQNNLATSEVSTKQKNHSSTGGKDLTSQMIHDEKDKTEDSAIFMSPTSSVQKKRVSKSCSVFEGTPKIDKKLKSQSSYFEDYSAFTIPNNSTVNIEDSQAVEKSNSLLNQRTNPSQNFKTPTTSNVPQALNSSCPAQSPDKNAEKSFVGTSGTSAQTSSSKKGGSVKEIGNRSATKTPSRLAINGMGYTLSLLREMWDNGDSTFLDDSCTSTGTVETSMMDESFITKRKRKRVRKRKKKSSNQVENTESDYSFVPTEPTLYKQVEFSRKPAVHIKFDEDGAPLGNVADSQDPIVISDTSNISIDNSTYSKDTIKPAENKLSLVLVGGKSVIEDQKSSVLELTSELDFTLSSEEIEKYPLMGSLVPRKGDIIAFKVFKLSEAYTPELSKFIIGRVLNFIKETKQVTISVLEGHCEIQAPKGKFSLDEEEDYDPEPTLEWDILKEKRLLFP